ncbi:putative lipoprotein/autotransporter domain-containing protein [Shigella sonnei]|nr:putative lipoprotein/autotransporter domain-containing protein [Shigella sonnei]
MLIDVPKPWNDPIANNPLTTLNLLEHDDSHVGVQLVKAQTVIGSGGSLTLRDLQGGDGQLNTQANRYVLQLNSCAE